MLCRMDAEVPWPNDPSFTLIRLDAAAAIAAEDDAGIAILLSHPADGPEIIVHVHDYDNLAAHLETTRRNAAIAGLNPNFVAIRRIPRPQSNTPFDNFRLWVDTRTSETAELRRRLRPMVRF
jgi:hypothetical protein